MYEGMFLLDNRAVRTDWAKAKSAVTDTLVKHGCEVVAARRWDERKLTYPIKGRKRATYLLAYFHQPIDRIQPMRRDLELDERLLRHLIVAVEGLPEGELEKSRAELEAGFTVPPPPSDEESFLSQNEADEELAEEPADEAPLEGEGVDETAAEEMV